MAGIDGEPLLLTHEQARKKLGVSKTHFYELLRDGEITNLHLGPQTRRISLAELEEYAKHLLDSQRGNRPAA